MTRINLFAASPISFPIPPSICSSTSESVFCHCMVKVFESYFQIKSEMNLRNQIV